jgi:hypothetical protein
MGTEVACKTWLSGGKVICDHKTHYAHCFRTQGSDFGFPYPLGGREVERTREGVRDLFLNSKWEKQIYPLSWLLEKFWPISGWSDEDLDKLKKSEAGKTFVPAPVKKEWKLPVLSKPSAPTWGVVYYSDNNIDPEIITKCQRQILKCVKDHRIISVSLKPMEFGENIVLPLERGYLTMFKQILAGLEASTADYIFFAEQDVVYHPSHFLFVPEKKDVFYYNENVWKVRMSDGHGLHYDCQQLSGLCAYRDLLIEHYRKRVEIVEKNGFTMRTGFEPGTNSRKERIDDYKAESWRSEYPIIDLRHEHNLTKSRWRKEEFRNQKFTEGWLEQDNVPGFGHLWHFWKRI